MAEGRKSTLVLVAGVSIASASRVLVLEIRSPLSRS